MTTTPAPFAGVTDPAVAAKVAIQLALYKELHPRVNTPAAETFTPGPRHFVTVGKPRADGLSFIIENQEDLEHALSAIFEAAKPEHGLLNVGWLEYDRAIAGRHVARFADEDTVYEVFFDQHLALYGISRGLHDVWFSERAAASFATGGFID